MEYVFMIKTPLNETTVNTNQMTFPAIPIQ